MAVASVSWETRRHVGIWACAETSGTVLPLKDENFAEHPVSHGEGDQHSHYPGQSSAGLRQNGDVGDGVEDPTPGENAEVKQSGWELRSSESVKQADQYKRNNVLNVVLMTSGERKQGLFKPCFLHNNITTKLHS